MFTSFFAFFNFIKIIDQTKIEPKDFVEQDYIDQFQNENLFFQAVKYITTVSDFQLF